jgi:hypothetical protein
MFELIIRKYFKPGTLHIFAFSFLVFIVLNVIENVIHYNIGKYHDENKRKGNSKNGTGVGSGVGGDNDDISVAGIHFTNPSQMDWVRIVVIMLIFAVLQGVFTSYFSVC